ncbi:MAG: radical SAM protein [Planctomycetota bacterium]|jgi:MoaA/NifB/PqqE/SkfB family radical SAM enzyme
MDGCGGAVLARAVLSLNLTVRAFIVAGRDGGAAPSGDPGVLASRLKKWRLFRAWSGLNPVWCTWQVTYRCNFHCGFCHYWKDPMGELPEQSVEQIATGAGKLAKLGSLLISIAGGEPFLRPDMVDIVREVARFHFPFVTTNGWFITPKLASDLFEAGLWGASVSIDYADPAKHDKRRGMRGCYQRAVAALEYFSRARKYDWQRVNLMCVLLDDNLDQIEPLIRLAAEHDAFFMTQPYGLRKTGIQRFVNTGDSIGQHLLALKRQHRNVLSNEVFLSQFDTALNGGVPGCRAGQAFFNIDSAGDIALWRAKPVANLYRHAASEIVRRLRDQSRSNTCTACWYNCRGEVEMLYHPVAIVKSLPTLFFDRGRPSQMAPVGCNGGGQRGATHGGNCPA